ncbi:YesL family protein [Jeotgalibaca caeni]|uniref:YesL family protein n=1 Tax=Jeotgalibaca caeni TaxID=3028623 RepID=UPI00237E5FE5|nr:YesL family protein [Jeotgalibaca caeni]MDE1548929.1 YesL family protein [Jeotgalibaca caeni]
MSEKPDFEKRKMFVWSNYVYWLMVTNVQFLIAIIPTLLLFIFVTPAIENLILYVLLLLPVGPALGALIASMIQILEKKDLTPMKDFWRYYRNNWWDSFRLWGLFVGVEAILIVDILFNNELFGIQTSFFSFFFLLLFFLVALVLIPTFLISIKFKFTFKDLLKLGMFYTLTRIKLTIGNACILFITYVVMVVTVEMLPLLFMSVFMYLLVAYNFDILSDIKGKYIK